MQTVILCGGSGTRLREMTEYIPKGLVPIGGIPMVTHIMRWYAKYGFREFVLALGYKQEQFKEYFAHYSEINNDVTFHIGSHVEYHRERAEWKDFLKVTLCDTGEDTFKGARLKRIEKYIIGDTFFCTYGDGVSDVNLNDLLSFHKSHGKIATITGVHPIPRFGEIHHQGGKVLQFTEKPPDDDCLMNGGFMVFNRRIFDYLSEDPWCDLEVGPFELLAAKGELQVFHHKGFWRCVDTLKDLGELQTMWKEGNAKWKA